MLAPKKPNGNGAGSACLSTQRPACAERLARKRLSQTYPVQFFVRREEIQQECRKAPAAETARVRLRKDRQTSVA
jgi:hypothetical protein